MAINTVTIVGNLTRKPELKDGPSISICSFTVAVNMRQKVGDAYEDVAHFIDCTAFKANADFLANYADKGNLVGVTGSLNQERWENQNGQKRSKLVVRADNVKLYTRKADADKTPDVQQSLDGIEAAPF
jgi:single-strand DNA-binding protein